MKKKKNPGWVFVCVCVWVGGGGGRGEDGKGEREREDFREDSFSEGTFCAGKQTVSNKSCLLCKL